MQAILESSSTASSRPIVQYHDDTTDGVSVPNVFMERLARR